MSACVMGIDLGTQSVKVLVYEPDTRRVLDKASASLELIARDDGSREQLAEWWLAALRLCLAEISDDLKASIVAIGVSGQQHGFVPLSDSGEVLAPVKLWCDTATVSECDSLLTTLGGEASCRELAGNSIAVGYTASKILWLKNHRPDVYNRMATILLPHDYLNFYLTGRHIMECGDASGTGLLDVRRRRWCAELVQALDPERDLQTCLPALIDAHTPAGEVTEEVAAELGLPEGVIVSAGGGDNMMAAIGTGNVRNGCLTASMGTSGTLYGYSDTPVVDSEGDLAAFCSSTGGWLPLLCTMNCTVATEQLRELFSLEVEQLESLVKGVAPGAGGVLTLPFYNGERTPALPNGKAVIFGLDPENTRQSHLLRSAMEAAVFGLKTGLDAFERNGMGFSELTLTGGGSGSAVWSQMCADVLNLPVRVLPESENAAFGAALQALWCYRRCHGEACELSALVEAHLNPDDCRRYTPQPETVAAYQSIYHNYQALLRAVKPLY